MNIIAAYAAVMSSVVFAWDVVKWWRGGAAFRVTAKANMIEASPGVGVGTPAHIVVNFYNVGTMTTTVTHVVFEAYKSRLHRMLGLKPVLSAFVPRPSPIAVPFELKPGHYFMCMTRQTEELEGCSREYALFAGVAHTLSKQEKLVHLKPIDPKH